MTEPLSLPLPGSRARPAWLLYAAIALYLVSLSLPAEAGTPRSLPIWILLAMGWAVVPSMLSNWADFLGACIWLSNFVVLAALWTSTSRRVVSVELAGLAVLMGLPAFASFTAPWSMTGSIVHTPDIGTYVWMAAYLLLFAHCWRGYRVQRTQLRASGV